MSKLRLQNQLYMGYHLTKQLKNRLPDYQLWGQLRNWLGYLLRNQLYRQLRNDNE